MPLFSAFTPFGLLAFSSQPSDAERYYREIVDAYTDPRTGRPIVDLSQGTYKEAWAYATAKALGCVRSTLKRARNQHHPGTAFELLRAWESSLDISPPEGATLAERQAFAAARYRLVRGFRFEAIQDALQSLLGPDFLELLVSPSYAQWPRDNFREVRAYAARYWRVIDQVGIVSFVDDTSDFASAAGGTGVQVFPTGELPGDYAAIGHRLRFGKIAFDFAGGTAGVGGTVAWEYWNGTAWAALSGVHDHTFGFTTTFAVERFVIFDVPGNWQKTTLGTDAAPLYYVRARVTGSYGTDPVVSRGRVYVEGPGNFVDEQTPASNVRLLEPVPNGGAQDVLYENWNPVDPEVALAVNDRICVDPENTGLSELVVVESVSGSGATRSFRATFAREHAAGTSATTGPTPLLLSDSCRALVVLKAAASANRDKVRLVDELMERHAPARTAWAVVKADSDTTPTYVPAFAMQTQPLGETVIESAVLAAYTPLSEAGVTCWTDPRDAGYVAGQSVASAPDKTGNGNDLVQATAGFRPIVTAGAIGAQQAMKFDGVDDFLSSTTLLSAIISASACTLYVVFQPDFVSTTAAAVRDNYPVLTDSLQGRIGIHLKDTGQIVALAYNDDGSVDATPGVAIDAWKTAHTARLRHSGGTLFLSIDGGPEASVASGNTSVLTGKLTVGLGWSAYAKISVGTVIAANVAHSAEAMSRVEAYLRREWRI